MLWPNHCNGQHTGVSVKHCFSSYDTVWQCTFIQYRLTKVIWYTVLCVFSFFMIYLGRRKLEQLCQIRQDCFLLALWSIIRKLFCNSVSVYWKRQQETDIKTEWCMSIFCNIFQQQGCIQYYSTQQMLGKNLLGNNVFLRHIVNAAL